MTTSNAQTYGESSLMLNVSMPSLIGDYDDATTPAEWLWVISNASFTHQHDEYEAIINVAMIEVEGDSLDHIPEKIRPVFAHAIKKQVQYVLFYNE